MGYWPLGLWDSLRSLLLVALLFSGPLYEALVLDGLWEDWMTLQPLFNIWYEWTSWRNLVAVSLAQPDPLVTRSTQPRRGIDRLYSCFTGSGDRGTPLSVCRCPPPRWGRHVTWQHRLPDAHHLRPRSHPSLLRVPPDPSSRFHLRRRCPLVAAADVHDPLRSICDLCIHQNRESPFYNYSARLLQRNGPPSILGPRPALLDVPRPAIMDLDITVLHIARGRVCGMVATVVALDGGRQCACDLAVDTGHTV